MEISLKGFVNHCFECLRQLERRAKWTQGQKKQMQVKKIWRCISLRASKYLEFMQQKDFTSRGEHEEHEIPG